jgi:hypothetical protein
MGARARLWWLGMVCAALFVALFGFALASGAGSGGAEAVARRWVEVHDLGLADCETLDLYTADYLEEHGFSKQRCEEDPTTFFAYWFVESQTSDSDYELVDVDVQGETAVAEVEENGGTVPHLRLFMVLEDGGWRIEAVGAELS